ncbi:peroxiredoxin [Riemerella anatipestifer]|uniref:peroxiredoxin family protein n=1 Tax=Riemerella anatipestifer TaxID=34085 RepID=UPI00129DC44B|nr:TlpA disulfide reductase family protein [Riemerella anatipestifer]MRM84341.1 TlpA family protein disulfide reductase [Riemerella anatipestifer]
MKTIKYLLVISGILFCSSSVFSQEKNANQILKKVSQNLTKINLLSYDLRRELNYSSEDYKAISKWTCYYSFNSDENPIGLRFQIENSNATDIYNGTEFFTLNKEDKTSKLLKHLKKEELSDKSYFYNSILTLRNILPTIIDDDNIKKQVSDTLINTKTYFQVKIDLGKRMIQNLGEGFDKMEGKNKFIYTILIDSESYLPKEIKQTNNLNDDFVKTTFENINLYPKSREENTWFYSNYLNTFKEAEEQSKINLSLGTEAPNWELTLLDDKKKISLKDLKGKVVILDFWIKNCGNCIANVPFINDLHQKFKNENLALFGINAYDSNDKIKEFYTKYGLNYQVLTNGEQVAKNYGVYAYPTIIIIDKDGKIIFNENENSNRSIIEQTIMNALK